MGNCQGFFTKSTNAEEPSKNNESGQKNGKVVVADRKKLQEILQEREGHE